MKSTIEKIVAEGQNLVSAFHHILEDIQKLNGEYAESIQILEKILNKTFARNKQHIVICEWCGKETLGNRKKRFCSSACRTAKHRDNKIEKGEKS